MRRRSQDKALRCPCCQLQRANGWRSAAVVADGRIRRHLVTRHGVTRHLLRASVRCLKCGWEWWTTHQAGLRLAGRSRQQPVPQRLLRVKRADVVLCRCGKVIER